MKKNCIVLGAGRVGRVIALDLSTEFQVTIADAREHVVQELAGTGIKVMLCDLSDPNEIQKVVAPFDIVVGALPGVIGFQSLEAVIQAGKNCVDISFFPEDALALDGLAKQQGVTCIVDCGVAPGISNWVLGDADRWMEVSSFHCVVGGLPMHPEDPWKYKAVFSPMDVIAEYIRPARFIRGGKEVTLPAMTECELIELPHAGILESFNTDGLRSLLTTMSHIPDMVEKTLRYPGTIEKLQLLKDCGFFSDTPVNDAQRNTWIPLETTAQLLLPMWQLGVQEDEFTVMQINIQGTKEGKPLSLKYDLYDRRDPVTGYTSMSRTTGFTCAAAVHLLAKGMYQESGVIPPEYLGKVPGTLDWVLRYLKERNVILSKEINS